MDSCVIDAKCSITQLNSFHRRKNHMFCMLAWQICHDKTWPNIYQHLYSKMLMTNCIIIGWSKSMVSRYVISLYAIYIMKCVEFIFYLSYHITVLTQWYFICCNYRQKYLIVKLFTLNGSQLIWPLFKYDRMQIVTLWNSPFW